MNLSSRHRFVFTSVDFRAFGVFGHNGFCL